MSLKPRNRKEERDWHAWKSSWLSGLVLSGLVQFSLVYTCMHIHPCKLVAILFLLCVKKKKLKKMTCSVSFVLLAMNAAKSCLAPPCFFLFWNFGSSGSCKHMLIQTLHLAHHAPLDLFTIWGIVQFTGNIYHSSTHRLIFFTCAGIKITLSAGGPHSQSPPIHPLP